MRAYSLITILLFACAPARAQLLPAGSPASNRITFDDEVNSQTVSNFISSLKSAQANSPEYIVVDIDTPGGSVGAGFVMSRAIESSPVPVVCVVDGMAASMGFFILQSCHVRVMTSRSLLMGHEPAGGGSSGFAQDHANDAALLAGLNRAMSYHITSRSSMTPEQYQARISGGKEMWLDFPEALALGFIDKVVLFPAQIPAP